MALSQAHLPGSGPPGPNGNATVPNSILLNNLIPERGPGAVRAKVESESLSDNNLNPGSNIQSHLPAQDKFNHNSVG